MFVLEMIATPFLSLRCDRPDIATYVRWTLTSPMSLFSISPRLFTVTRFVSVQRPRANSPNVDPHFPCEHAKALRADKGEISKQQI